MCALFSNILIPVDFSVNTHIAVQKAIWLSSHNTTVIHLLHVDNSITGTSVHYMHSYMAQLPFITTIAKNNEYKMQEIKKYINDYNLNIQVNIYIIKEELIQDAIIKVANELTVDLIIIGKNKNHNWFPFLKSVNASHINKKTECAVLTVKPGGFSNKIKSVVIPVGNTNPQKKIDLLNAITGNGRPKIHLIVVNKKEELYKWPGAFLQAYRTLVQYQHYPVEYEILKGKPPAKVIFNYTKSVKADFVILNSSEESKINTLSGMQINDLVLPGSKLKVITM